VPGGGIPGVPVRFLPGGSDGELPGVKVEVQGGVVHPRRRLVSVSRASLRASRVVTRSMLAAIRAGRYRRPPHREPR
jgi:hypothetical protein